MLNEKLPFVSVIVPNYNNEKRLKKCLENLQQQSYPDDLMEIIVIDNGSTDGALEIIKKSGVIYFIENTRKNPYVCRNIGMRKAKGDVIAFIDSKCIPKLDWIEQGILVLRKEKADLVGGHFNFEFSAGYSIAEIAYSLSYLDNEKTILQNGGIPTGNLFVHIRVIEKIGFFSENFRSATDIVWTKKAIESGFNLAYAPKAITFYLAKNKEQQLEGAFRDGISTYLTLKKSYPIWKTVLSPFYVALPLSFSEVEQLINQRGKPVYQQHFFKIWLAIWRIRATFGLGMLCRGLGFVKKKLANHFLVCF